MLKATEPRVELRPYNPTLLRNLCCVHTALLDLWLRPVMELLFAVASRPHWTLTETFVSLLAKILE